MKKPQAKKNKQKVKGLPRVEKKFRIFKNQHEATYKRKATEQELELYHIMAKLKEPTRQDIEELGFTLESIPFKQEAPEEKRKKLNREFSALKPILLKILGSTYRQALKEKMQIKEENIKKFLCGGYNIKGYNFQHKRSRFTGGKNNLSNLLFIQAAPYHLFLDYFVNLQLQKKEKDETIMMLYAQTDPGIIAYGGADKQISYSDYDLAIEPKNPGLITDEAIYTARTFGLYIAQSFRY